MRSIGCPSLTIGLVIRETIVKPKDNKGKGEKWYEGGCEMSATGTMRQATLRWARPRATALDGAKKGNTVVESKTRRRHCLVVPAIKAEI
jgi:hypothetical protein